MTSAAGACVSRRAPYGARGLKFLLTMGILLIGGRAPYGARGLKSRLLTLCSFLRRVAPRMGRVD